MGDLTSREQQGNDPTDGLPSVSTATAIEDLLAHHRANGDLMEWLCAVLNTMVRAGDFDRLTTLQIGNLLRRFTEAEYPLIETLRRL